MQDIYQTFEFPLIKEKIRTYARSELGKELSLSISMISSVEALKIKLDFLDEIMSISLRYGLLPITHSKNLLPLIDFALKGGVLSIIDLEAVASDVITIKSVKDYFRKVEDKYKVSKDYIIDFVDLSFLEVEIHKIIAKDLTIFDNASDELLSIRRSLTRLDKEISSRLAIILTKYKDMLSDPTITIRDGHFVLPFKSGEKNKIDGIIHDVSDSGMTTFIEPSEIVEINNKIYLLKNKEKEEINRLLRMLTKLVIASKDDVIKDNKMIGELDFLQAKAIYGNEIQGIVANISKEEVIDLKDARHPLIDAKVVIANDFYYSPSQKIILISGPNAGGKTVALKTLGLLVLMHECGLAIPTSERSEICFIKNIYVDIGDNQSLQDNLSTFSGHISNLAKICQFASTNDLVLLDEIGTGTSPKEGESLALAVVEYLLNKGVFAMISSHFDKLKEYALTNEKIINASMLFDEARLLPTYRLKMGLPGKSYGLEVANRYKLDESIIKRAKEYLSIAGTSEVSSAISALSTLVKANEAMKLALNEKENELLKKESSLSIASEALNKKKESLLSDTEQIKEEMISDIEKELDDILSSINKKEVKPHEVIEAKKKLDSLREQNEDVKFSDVINIGNYVLIPSLNIKGKVVRMNQKKISLITSDGLSFEVDKDKAQHIDTPKETTTIKKRNNDTLLFKTNVKLECNLIGLHVDEAIIMLEKYLDDCRVKHFSQVRIIHGFGSGALRNATHEYLRSCPFVESFTLGGQFDGGGGATLVKLK